MHRARLKRRDRRVVAEVQKLHGTTLDGGQAASKCSVGHTASYAGQLTK